jgi:hypothetical protein
MIWIATINVPAYRTMWYQKYPVCASQFLGSSLLTIIMKEVKLYTSYKFCFFNFTHHKNYLILSFIISVSLSLFWFFNHTHILPRLLKGIKFSMHEISSHQRPIPHKISYMIKITHEKWKVISDNLKRNAGLCPTWVTNFHSVNNFTYRTKIRTRLKYKNYWNILKCKILVVMNHEYFMMMYKPSALINELYLSQAYLITGLMRSFLDFNCNK